MEMRKAGFGRGTDDAPLLFWREGEGGRRVGLACLTDFCVNPDCTCREALVLAFEVDEGFERITTSGEKVDIHSRGEGGRRVSRSHVAAVVNLDTGRVGNAVDGEPMTTQEAALLRWLQEELDAAVLEDLRGRWERFKEARQREAEQLQSGRWKELDWTEWDGDEPVGWYEVAGGVEDRYELDEETYEALDHYCIRPGCDCQQVRVDFCRVVGDEIEEMVGGVIVEGGEVVGTTNLPGARRTLERLWAAYEARHDLGELVHRWEEMQRIGPEIHDLRERQLHPEPLRRERVAGRNDPCPCGSGRKYKKCCLGRG